MAKDKEESEVVKETKKQRYELVEVPTSTAMMVRDNKTEEVLDTNIALVHILNVLDEIKKGLV